MASTEIRLIIFFAAKDGEALYSQTELNWTQWSPHKLGGQRSPNHEGVPQTSGIGGKNLYFTPPPNTLYSQPSVNIPLTIECVVILSDHLYKLPATLQGGWDSPRDLVWKWKFREASSSLQSQQGAVRCQQMDALWEGGRDGEREEETSSVVYSLWSTTTSSRFHSGASEGSEPQRQDCGSEAWNHSSGRTSQWLRLHAHNAGGPGSIPGQGTRSHVPQLKILHATLKTEDSECHN